MKKNEIRQHYKTKRKSESSKQREDWSRSIIENVCSSFALEGKKISLFLPIERFQEINTWHFLDQLDATFILPVVKDNGTLVHIRFEGKEQIRISDWGIPEPTYGEELDPEVIDIVLVPLLAADRSGYRVGYGKGFYDQFLSSCRPDTRFIGLSYYPPISEIEDVHSGDVPLHFLVTPQEIFDFTKSK